MSPSLQTFRHFHYHHHHLFCLCYDLQIYILNITLVPPFSHPLTEKSSEQLLTVIWAGLGWQKSSLPEPGLLLQCQSLSGGQHQLAVPHPLQAHQVTDQAVPLLL